MPSSQPPSCAVRPSWTSTPSLLTSLAITLVSRLTRLLVRPSKRVPTFSTPQGLALRRYSPVSRPVPEFSRLTRFPLWMLVLPVRVSVHRTCPPSVECTLALFTRTSLLTYRASKSEPLTSKDGVPRTSTVSRVKSTPVRLVPLKASALSRRLAPRYSTVPVVLVAQLLGHTML